MANWIKSGTFWRNLHLTSSILIIIFTALFLLSGFIMIKHRVFKAPVPVKHTTDLPLTIQFSRDSLVFAKELKKTYKLHGRIEKPVKLNDGRWRFIYSRPANTQVAFVNASRDSVQIVQTVTHNYTPVLSRLHHLRGFRGGWKYAVWGILYDAAALSFIVFALTGILMWYKMKNRLKAGWIFLGTGFTVVLLVIFSLYFLI